MDRPDRAPMGGLGDHVRVVLAVRLRVERVLLAVAARDGRERLVAGVPRVPVRGAVALGRLEDAAGERGERGAVRRFDRADRVDDGAEGCKWLVGRGEELRNEDAAVDDERGL